jgi:hypothetical protein
MKTFTQPFTKKRRPAYALCWQVLDGSNKIIAEVADERLADGVIHTLLNNVVWETYPVDKLIGEPPVDVTCGNCTWIGTDQEVGFVPLEDCHDLEERLEPGDEVPAGECPLCHALAYLVKKDK